MDHKQLLARRKDLKARQARGQNVADEMRENERLIRESRKARGGAAPSRRVAKTPNDIPKIAPIPPAAQTTESDEERSKRISTRFSTLDRMATRLVENKIPALIVSGPPGLGKSYTLETKADQLEGSDKPVTIISGSISAPGLLIALYEHREGGTVVLDDCDDVFRDETTLNLLKAVLDSSAKRVVSYRKMAKWMEDLDIPQTFEFKGSVAFCTNIDFETEIARGNRMATHFKALLDRSSYLTLTLRSKEDYLTRIRQVAVEEKLLETMGLENEQAEQVMEWVVNNADRCFSLSLRLVMQVAQCIQAEPETWREDAEATQLRTLL